MAADDANTDDDGSTDDDASTEAERWLVVNGRRWRRTDPSLPEPVVERLKSHLGRGRSGVRVAKSHGDEQAVADARTRVGLAKHGLGERGPRWWESSEAERLERAEEALRELDRLDEPDTAGSEPA
ncbi:biopolymer transporter Tol [Marisediminicola sp. LYQ134]|uniref:biopolymer transporter Tol n=1 Tax=Marisediminicola sp. LYQ134 TaxID=3391061 RepID=UPI003982DA46